VYLRHHTIERRPYRAAIDPGRGDRDIRIGRPDPNPRQRQFQVAHRSQLRELFVRLACLPRLFKTGPGFFEAGPLDSTAKRDQRIPRLEGIAFVDMQAIDPTSHLYGKPCLA